MTYLVVRYPEHKIVFVADELDVAIQHVAERMHDEIANHNASLEPVTNTYRIETVW